MNYAVPPVWYNTPMRLIECIPNISEGRRPEVVADLVRAVRTTPAIRLLDVTADASHHRSVLTFAGPAPALTEAVLALVERAIATIDLRTHSGEHPRIGAVDVVPFVPLDGVTLDECVQLARVTAAEVAHRFQVPVYLYEAAATAPHRRNLAEVRRGGFEGLAVRMQDPAWTPDFGPAHPHPSAGAIAMGARGPLIAFNVNLADARVEVARAIAREVRERDGGLPAVKAIPVHLADRGLVQVSMNLTDFHRTSMTEAYDAVSRAAARYGITVLESELIGLVPDAALPPDPGLRLKLRGFSRRMVLEDRLAQCLAGDDGVS